MTTARSRLRSPVQRYGEVIHRPGAIAFFTAAAIARLGVAMTGLGLLLTVRHATGSFATAGAATGGFAVAEAVIGPQILSLEQPGISGGRGECGATGRLRDPEADARHPASAR